MGGRWASWSRQSAWGEDGGESPPPVVTYSVSGTITGDVVEGVTVTLSGDDSDSVVTGPSGAYSFSGLADGSYTVTPSLAGYGFTPAATNVTVSGADQTGKDFVSTLITWSLSGTVTGDVVEGVTITLTGDASDSTTTDENGDYSFSGLVDGSYNVEPSLEGYIFDPTDIDVTIADADDVDNDFVSSGVYTISGTIVDGAAAGIEGVTVALTGDATDSTTTAADGTYSFTGVVDGSYTVTPTLDGYTFAPENASVTISGADDTGNDFVSSVDLVVHETSIDWEAGGVLDGASWQQVLSAGSSLASQTNKDTIESIWTPSKTKSVAQAMAGSTVGSRYCCSYYLGFSNAGKAFDVASGIRLMVVARRSSGTGNFQLQVGIGDSRETKNDYGPDKYMARATYSNSLNPDKWYLDVTANSGFSRLYDNTAGQDTSTELRWFAIGLEIPAGLSGNLVGRVYSGGSTIEKTVALAGDFSNLVFDMPFFSFTSESGANVTFDFNSFWVGTASDDWPT